jgi:hypothetical protein
MCGESVELADLDRAREQIEQARASEPSPLKRAARAPAESDPDAPRRRAEAQARERLRAHTRADDNAGPAIEPTTNRDIDLTKRPAMG